MNISIPVSKFRVGSFAPRHYRNAPIIEAIISLAIELPVHFQPEHLGTFHKYIESAYPQATEERAMKVAVGPESVQPTSFINGFRYVSEDGKYVLACRRSSFSLSRLAPYENWEAFQDEARGLWTSFASQLGPVKITGVSTRYINRIDIPHEGQYLDFRWYFRTFPEISTDLDVGLSGFLMRLDIPLNEINAHLILNQSLLPAPPSPKALSVVLDADIVSGFDEQSNDGVWERLQILRKAKNDVFEACITNLARELFT